MKHVLADRLYDYFQRVDRVPPSWTSSLPLPLDVERRGRFRQRILTLQLPVDPLGGSIAPPIELLIVAAEKDFPLLSLATTSAVRNSLNPIVRSTYVVPETAMQRAEVLSKELSCLIEVECVSEDELIGEDSRRELKKAFRHRYGWVLQQLLIVAFVAASQSAAVLVLDADTILMRQRVFLSGKQQVLMPSLENHNPYFEFLRSLDPRLDSTANSYVSHHMVQQPEVLRSILNEFCGGSFDSLLLQVAGSSLAMSESPLCVDYELYAQGIKILFPERVVAAKWSNVSWKRSELSHSLLKDLSRHYCSVSLHDHLG